MQLPGANGEGGEFLEMEQTNSPLRHGEELKGVHRRKRPEMEQGENPHPSLREGWGTPALPINQRKESNF
jgi:hypothetical protein